MGATEYSCGHCGYKGPAYGAAVGSADVGVSAPWCPRCNLNDKMIRLTPVRVVTRHPLIPPIECDAVETVLALGAQFGYGNLINRLKEKWSEVLQKTQGMDEKIADATATFVCPYCGVDGRTGQKVLETAKE